MFQPSPTNRQGCYGAPAVSTNAMHIGRRDITVDTVLLEQSFTLTKSEAQRHFERKNTCPRCKKLILYTVTYEPGGKVRRILNPKDPAALVECPRCHQRWFFFNQPVEIQFVDTERFAEHVYVDEMILDNRKGSSPLVRKRTVSEEWTQTYEIERDETHTQSNKVGAGIEKVASIEITAEQAVKERYSISEQKKQTYTEELSFEVPPGVYRKVSVVFKQIWQSGVVRLSLPSAGKRVETRETKQVDVPFRVVIDVTMDLVQEDSRAGDQALTESVS